MSLLNKLFPKKFPITSYVCLDSVKHTTKNPRYKGMFDLEMWITSIQELENGKNKGEPFLLYSTSQPDIWAVTCRFENGISMYDHMSHSKYKMIESAIKEKFETDVKVQSQMRSKQEIDIINKSLNR